MLCNLLKYDDPPYCGAHCHRRLFPKLMAPHLSVWLESPKNPTKSFNNHPPSQVYFCLHHAGFHKLGAKSCIVLDQC